MGKLKGEIYFLLRYLTGKIRHEVVAGEVESEIYADRIYKVNFPSKTGSISNFGKVYTKVGKKVFVAAAKLETRGDSLILTLVEKLKETRQNPIIEIHKIVTATVTPFSSLPQFDIEIKIEKYDLSVYTASLTSDQDLLFVGDYLSSNDIQLEVIDVAGRNLRLKEVG